MSSILVADGDRLVRSILCGALARAGHATVEAADGLEALAIARSDHPDVVVLSTVMAKARGIEVCRELRCDAGQGPAIVILGGRPTDRRLAVDAGADAFLVKPVNLAELVRVVDRGLLRQVAA